MACIVISVLLLSLSIDALGEAPTLEEPQTPSLPDLMPEISPTINPESTKLEKPDTEMSKVDPIFRVRGLT